MKTLTLNEIERSKAVTQRLVDLKRGCIDCNHEIQPLNDAILKQKFDLMMDKAAGVTPPTTTTLTGYFGSKSTAGALTQSQIESGTPFSYINQGDLTIPFNVPTRQYYWFAIRSTQPVKTKYQDVTDANNNGHIGLITDLFGAPTLVGNYYFYITNYPSIQLNAFKIKNT